MANTARPQTLAIVVMGVALLSGKGMASEAPLSALRRSDHLDGSSSEWPSNSHVRSAERHIRALLLDGVARSSTFRALVSDLNMSDVIVHIESNPRIRAGFNGYLAHHVTLAGAYRFLLVVVTTELPRDRLIGVIAHELQHAVEIAEAAGVRSDADMRALFKRLDSGRCGSGRTCTETDAAVRREGAVLDELKGRTAPGDR